MQYHYIYKTTLLLGSLAGKYYIGKRSTDSRRNVLPEEDVDYAGSGNVVRRYFKKYGKIPGVTHIKEIIEVNSDKRTNGEREREIIGNLYETDPMCLNEIRGGWGGGWYTPGHTVSEETRKKLSEKKKGRHLSEEHKQKISLSNKGKKMTEETKKRMSEAQKGHTVSEKTRNIFSEMNKGRSPSNRIPVIVVNLCDNTEHRVDSITKAAEIAGVSIGSAFYILKGRSKQTRTGYTFKYAEKEKAA